MSRPTNPLPAVMVALVLLAGACSDDSSGDRSVTMLTHDSFQVSSEVFDEFTATTGIEVELLASGDAGQMVSQSILTAGDPLADVMFGIDSTFLQRGLDADLFEVYESPALADVPDEFELDPEHRVTPVDFGDVCINYWTDALTGPVPTTLEDLTAPEHAGQLVVQNPETSSPGLAFLLATVAGTDDWEGFWSDLVANGVTVTSGWEDAYGTEFVAGGGDRSLVVSYGSSPVAEVLFAETALDEPPTGVLLDSCFRQIEFAGVLAGTEKGEEARALIDFLLSPTFQDDVPLSMFVFPVAESATLPPEFVRHATIADDPLTLSPLEIETSRDAWTSRWVEIVLG